MGLGLKGTKMKKPQEKCCPFLPVGVNRVKLMSNGTSDEALFINKTSNNFLHGRIFLGFHNT